MQVFVENPNTIVIDVDQGRQGRGIQNITYTEVSGQYFLIVTYTDGTTETLGPLVVTGGAAFLLGGATGSIPYQSAPNTTVFLPIGTQNQVVVAGTSAPQYTSALTGLTVNNSAIGNTTPSTGAFTNLSASGTFALTGDQVQISEGGTGQTTANGAFNALAPSQTGNAGKYLKTDGTNSSWDQLDISTADITGTLPIANGGTGQTTANSALNALLPTQAAQSGKYLKTDGTNASWDQLDISTADITGVLPVANGGTGASTAAGARANLSAAILGTNNDITSMTGVTGGISTPDFVQFDTTATEANAVGKVYWDAAQGTLDLGLLGGNVVSRIGQSLVAYVTNAEAVTITKGQAVYLFGAQGNRATVKLASNLADATSAKTFGVVAENIPANGTGFVMCQGVLEGLNLGAYTAGDTLYLGATPGSLTATKPYAPNHLVYVGLVERANAGNGQLYVKVQNGYELDEIHDVQIINPQNGQTIIYDASTSLWKNANLTAGSGISVTNGAASITVSNTGVLSFSGGTTGLTPSTSTTGAVTLGGTLNIASGGTGQTTANASFNALAPSQTGNAGKYLKSDGTNTSWDQVDISTSDITGILPVLNGGTGANNASDARTNLNAASQSTTISAGTGLTGGGDLSANRTLSIANTTVTAGAYGSASNTLTATVNAQGQLTALAATPIAIANTQVSGLGTMSTQNSNSVTITGGSITGITDLAIADGGTGASTASGARTNLGLGTSAVLDAGVALGVATLDAGGTVPLSQLPASIQGGVSYQGSWDAATNTPTIVSSVGSKGYYYVVSVAGSTNINGITDWLPGDWIIFNGSVWQKIDNTDAVASVNGYTGAVVLNAADVGAPPTSRTITAGTGLTGGGDLSANRTISIANTTVTSGSYGSASSVGTFTVNGQGQLTAAASTPIAITNTQVSGLGTMSTQNANSVAITGGSITGITDLAVADGGTGASDAATARTNLGAAASAITISAGTGLSGGGDLSANRTLSIANTTVTAASYGSASSVGTFTVNAQGQLTAAASTPIAIANTQVSGLGTMSTQNANAVAITGGSIDGVTIGGSTTGAGSFTTLTTSSTVTLNGGTANGVAYLNGSKVLTSGSALTFDGTTLATQTSAGGSFLLGSTAVGTSSTITATNNNGNAYANLNYVALSHTWKYGSTTFASVDQNGTYIWYPLGTEGMRLTSTGLITQKDATIQGVTVGRGAGAVSTNTAVGGSALSSNTTGAEITAVGLSALTSNTTGSYNTAVGLYSLFSNTTGSQNAALGTGALTFNTTGGFNTAIGREALRSNTTASQNTAIGFQAGYSNTTGTPNVYMGYQAGYAATGSYSIAIGYQAGYNNTDFINGNIFVGYQAGYANTSGTGILAVGTAALTANTTGGYNTAVGRALVANTTGSNNTATGYEALVSNTTGVNNTAVGYQAARANTTGVQNTAIGFQTLRTNTTGGQNIAVGDQALFSNTTGSRNTAFGMQAMYSNTTGAPNSAFGHNTLYSNTTGGFNAAFGGGDNSSVNPALGNNTTGSYNSAFGVGAAGINQTGSYITAVGYRAAYSTTGDYITALGYRALDANTSGSLNTSVGMNSMFANTTGNYNTALGHDALGSNTTASNNTAVGYQALYANTTGTDNVAVGYQALDSVTTGVGNVAVGATQPGFFGAALNNVTTGNNNIGIGAAAGSGVTTGNDNIFIGRATTASASCTGALNIGIGTGTAHTLTSGNENVFIGGGRIGFNYGAGANNTTGSRNTFVGGQSGTANTTAGNNAFFGFDAGSAVTTGSKNTIIGNYTGNQGGLDIRTANNNIVLSDGDGNPAKWINVGNSFSTEYDQTGNYATSVARMGAAWGSASIINLLTVSNLGTNNYTLVKVRILIQHAVGNDGAEIEFMANYGRTSSATPTWSLGTPVVSFSLNGFSTTGTFSTSGGTLSWTPGFGGQYYRAAIFIDTVSMDGATVTYLL